MSKLVTMGNIPIKSLPKLKTLHKKKQTCKLKNCDAPRSILADAGSFYCVTHRKQHSKHDGFGKPGKDNEYTFDKVNHCEICEYQPFEDLTVCDPGGEIAVHHIKPTDDGGNDETDNLITVCHPCHHNVHYYITKLKKKYRKKILSDSQYQEALASAKQRKAKVITGVFT